MILIGIVRSFVEMNFKRTYSLPWDRLPDKTTWIEISGLKIDTLPRYAFFRFGNSLRTLDLVDCGITTIEDGAFAGLHKLQRLSLVGNWLPVVNANWFSETSSVFNN